MNYISTRDNKITVTSSQAILKGISDEGGLFVPQYFPKINYEKIIEMTHLTYCEKAEQILSLFLSDLTKEQISSCIKGAYSEEKFEYKDIAHLRKNGNSNYLELWHGPTCAFKDMALQLLPRLLVTAMNINKTDKTIVILVATSGDTGKAALEGFKDVDGTKIIVFYPNDGVSAMQKRQMQSQEGKNVSVCSIYGNFDDAQTGVKNIFTDETTIARLEENGFGFSSANSINWGRLVPQIVYYFSAYCDMLKNGEIQKGEAINFCVPTGNFGNILAGFYAKEMGLPIAKLICASNQNNVLTDFFKTGKYDKNRDFHQTISPSMDILISSNLERLLFFLSGNDSNYINEIFQKLHDESNYTIKKDILKKLNLVFYGGYCSDENTIKQIKIKFEKTGYLMDSHTAVADFVYDEYVSRTKDDTKTVIVSTASPFKFSGSVLNAIDENFNPDDDEFIMAEKLASISKMPIPKQLSNLKNKKVLFENVIKPDDMERILLNILEIE